MIQSIPLDLVATIATGILAVGGAFAGVKYGLNGARKDITEIKGISKGLEAGQSEVRVSVARIETGLEATNARVGRVENRLERHIEIDT